MTFCPTGENFRSARCARGKKAHFCIFFHRNVTESIPSRRKYHKSGKKCRHLLQPNHTKLVSYVTYLLGPQISSHLSRHDMTCLSGPQISSHLSRFISDKSPPKIESFVERIVATKRPWASRRQCRRRCLLYDIRVVTYYPLSRYRGSWVCALSCAFLAPLFY